MKDGPGKCGKVAHPARSEHDKLVLDRALRIIVPTMLEIDRNVVSGFAELGIADKVRSFKSIAASLEPTGSAVWMEIPPTGFPVYAGTETGLFGDDPDFPFPTADGACWAVQGEDIAGFLKSPEWSDVNPAYVLACVARSVCNQIPAMTLAEASVFAVTGCLPPSRKTVLEVHSDMRGTYGYSLHSSDTDISKNCALAVGRAMRTEPHMKAMRYEVESFRGTPDGKRSTSEGTDKMLEIYFAILEELGEDSSWEERRLEENRRISMMDPSDAEHFGNQLVFKNYIETTLRNRKAHDDRMRSIEMETSRMPSELSESAPELQDAAESNGDVLLVEMLESGFGQVGECGVERPSSLLGFLEARDLW